LLKPSNQLNLRRAFMLNFTHGGPIKYQRDQCKGCDPTATPASIAAKNFGNKELQAHNVSRHVPLDAYFHPALESYQKEDIACVEVNGVYPLAAGNEIWLTQVPPEKFATHLFIVPSDCPTVYGQPTATLAGFTFDVVSQAYDLLGAPVGAPVTHMAGVVASTIAKQGIAITPATSGIYTDANYLMFGIKPLTNPTSNPLSQVDCGFRLTVHALGD
jgi:hypothetical protein